MGLKFIYWFNPKLFVITLIQFSCSVTYKSNRFKYNRSHVLKTDIDKMGNKFNYLVDNEQWGKGQEKSAVEVHFLMGIFPLL